jgi:glycogen synthase
VLRTYEYWRRGSDDEFEVAATYSGQFFDVCRRHGHQGYLVSCHKDRAYFEDDRFRIEHLPHPSNCRGPLYHLGQLWWGMQFVARAVRYRAHVAVVSMGTYWFVFALLRLFGIRVIPTLHCVLWTKHRRPGRLWRLIHWADRFMFTRACTAILTLSDDITEQVTQLAGSKRRPMLGFLPHYRRDRFADLAAPSWKRRPLRVLFVGRITESKGVFELLEIARSLAARVDLQFDVCGDGPALTRLREQVEAAGLGRAFHCHGHQDKTQMRSMYEACHVVIVPTTTSFIEGFNKVVAEAILAGRPVITSSVCPALGYVRDAVVEVPPDDVAAYEAAIVRLATDEALYEHKVGACRLVQAQFFDPEKNWGAAFTRALKCIEKNDAGLPSVDEQPSPAPETPLPAPVAGCTGVVVIGRNEGERLRRCLESVRRISGRVVYVDSGSTDGSVPLARAAGAEVVELDPSIPFSAARGRNAGLARLTQIAPETEYVQFVDGDCEIIEGWLGAAAAQLHAREDVVAVCGRLRERSPQRSVYNRLCDLEWNGPTGEIASCGGIAMYRIARFREAGGFNPDVSAGEEPELCLRLRRTGGRIVRLKQDMAWHDAAMTRFSQWWKRAERGGQAYAQAMSMHGAARERHGVRQSAGIWFWSVILPLLSIVAGLMTNGWGMALTLLYPVLVVRIALYRMTARHDPLGHAALYAVFCVMGKWPQMIGQVRFGFRWWTRPATPRVVSEPPPLSVAEPAAGSLSGRIG